MFNKGSFIVLTFVGALTFSAVAAIELESYQHLADLGLLKFMTRSNDVAQRNPTRSLDCFNYYIPLINEIVKEYETNYKICLDNSAEGSAKANADTLDQRNELARKAKSSCDLLTDCKDVETAAGVFECYVDGGSENSKTMYGISTDASEQLADLQEKLRLIKNQENKCTTEEQRAYEQKSGKAYEDMNNCMLGITPVPTVAPSN